MKKFTQSSVQQTNELLDAKVSYCSRFDRSPTDVSLKNTINQHFESIGALNSELTIAKASAAHKKQLAESLDAQLATERVRLKKANEGLEKQRSESDKKLAELEEANRTAQKELRNLKVI